MTVRFDANDPRDQRCPQVTDHRRVGIQRIERGDDAQMRMILTELRQKPLQSVPFAIILRFAILPQDRLGHQRDDFLPAGTDNHRPQHLMMVGDLAVAMMFFQAAGAVDFVGREVLGAIESHQVVVIQEAELRQSPAPL